MQKKVRLLIVTALTLALLLLCAGCGQKTLSAAATPKAAAAQPADTASTDSAAPSAEPSPKASVPANASSAPADKPKDNTEKSPKAADVSLDNDGLGSLKLGMSETDLIKYLGEPESKSETVTWGADGCSHTDWYYPSKGLELNMTMSPEDSESFVFSVTAASPCKLATQRGIKLGDTKETVMKAYAGEYNADDSKMLEDSIVLGSVFGGIIMDIDNGVVTRIFIGAAAE